MPITLEGSCRCGAVLFSVQSHAPVPCVEPGDLAFDLCPDQSIQNWHREHGLWLD